MLEHCGRSVAKEYEEEEEEEEEQRRKISPWFSGLKIPYLWW